MYEHNERAFWALVGNTGAAKWADAAVAYITFYHLLFKGFPIDICVESMKVASGDHNFIWHSGQDTRAAWLTYIRNKLPGLGQRIDEATKTVS